jgi:hypothetical protein
MAQQKQDYGLHRAATFPTSLRRASKGTSANERRGLKTMLQPGANKCCSSLTASRIRRRTRLRTTALPIARGVVNPNSGPQRGAQPVSGGSGVRSRNAAKLGLVMRVPSSYTLRKSRDLRMRELFGNARVSEELPFSCGVLSDGFGVADDPFVADGQLPASALPAARKNRPAVHCLHAGAEAVLLRTLTVIRLKRSLRHIGEKRPRSRPGF